MDRISGLNGVGLTFIEPQGTHIVSVAKAHHEKNERLDGGLV